MASHAQGRGRGRSMPQAPAGRPPGQQVSAKLKALLGSIPPQGVTEQQFLSLWHQQHLEELQPQAYGCLGLQDFLGRFAGQQLRTVTASDGSWLIAPRPTREAFEGAVRRLRRALHDSGQQVTLARVMSQACQQLHVEDVRAVGFAHFKSCTALNEVQFLEQQINTIIACFLATRSLCTIWDLEQFICDQLNRFSSGGSGGGGGGAGGRGRGRGAPAAGGIPPPPPPGRPPGGAGQPDHRRSDSTAPGAIPPPTAAGDGGAAPDAPGATAAAAAVGGVTPDAPGSAAAAAAAGGAGAAVQFRSYTDLGMGPLLAHELVVANFRVPPELLEVPQIAATDVLTEMWSILRLRYRGSRDHDKSDLVEPLREVLVNKYQVPHFDHLGVRLPQGQGFLVSNLGSSVGRWTYKLNDARSRIDAMAHKEIEEGQKELKEGRKRLESIKDQYTSKVDKAAEQLQHIGDSLVRSCLGEYVEEVRQQLLEGGTTAVKEASMQLLLQPMGWDALQAALLPDGSNPGSTEEQEQDTSEDIAAASAGILALPRQLQGVDGPSDANGGVPPSPLPPHRGVLLSPLAMKQFREQSEEEAELQRIKLLAASPDMVAVLGMEKAADAVSSLQAIVNGMFGVMELHVPGPPAPSGTGPAPAAATGAGVDPDLDVMLQQMLDKFGAQLQEPSSLEAHQQQQQQQQGGDADVEAAAKSAAASVTAAQAAAKVLIDGLLGATGGDPVKGFHSILSSYWQADALHVLLMHALRASLQQGGLRRSMGGGQGTDGEEEHRAGQQAAMMAARREVGALELLHLFQEECMGSSLSALAQLEAQVLARLQVTSSDQLHLPGGAPSLLSLLCHQPDLGQLVTGCQGPGDVGCYSQEEVLLVVKQVVVNLAGRLGRYPTATDKLEALAGALEHALLSHYPVTNTLQLGYGTPQQLLQLLASTAAAPDAALTAEGSEAATPAEQLVTDLQQVARGQEQQQVLHVWAAQGMNSAGFRYAARMEALTEEHALAAISSAPMLCDLGSYCCWDALYGPQQGPLDTFVAEHQAQLQCTLLAVPGGARLKLPHGPGDLAALQTQLSTAVSRECASDVVAHLLAHVAAKGGVAVTDDLLLLSGVLGPLWSAAMTAHKGYTAAPPASWAAVAAQSGPSLRNVVEAGIAWLADFTLQCLQVLPLPMAAPLADALLLQPFVDAVGQGPQAAHQVLLAAAAAAAAGSGTPHAPNVAVGVSLRGGHQVLHGLGHMLGIEAWQDDCMAAILPGTLQVSGDISRPILAAAGGAAGAQAHTRGEAASQKEAGGGVVNSQAAAAMDELLLELLGPAAAAAAAAVEPAEPAHETAQDSTTGAVLEAAAGAAEVKVDIAAAADGDTSAAPAAEAEAAPVAAGTVEAAAPGVGDEVLPQSKVQPQTAATAAAAAAVAETPVVSDEPESPQHRDGVGGGAAAADAHGEDAAAVDRAVTHELSAAADAGAVNGAQPGTGDMAGGVSMSGQASEQQDMQQQEEEDQEDKERVECGKRAAAAPQQQQQQQDVEVDAEEMAAEAGQDALDVAAVSYQEQQEQAADAATSQQQQQQQQQPVVQMEHLPISPQQQLIRDIQRSYGVGLQLEGEAAAVFAENQQRLGLSVRRLAGELYSRDIHFVMELVQNADDCSYPDSLALRMLELVVTPRGVSLLSNEAGFSTKDVEGICNISRSKKEGVAGYTGQKGIGFKSVFRVTDFPLIFSNGYSFGFDRLGTGDLGYLLPTWVGSQHLPAEFDRALTASRLLHMTCPAAAAGEEGAIAALLGPGGGLTGLHLPLKSQLQDNVGAQLGEVQPTLLLFLRKLRALAVTDTVTGQSVLMLRKEQPGGIIQLHVRRTLLPAAAGAGAAAQGLGPAGAGHGSSTPSGKTAAPAVGAGMAGEVVVSSEMSSWLLVTDTFSPGDIKRLEVEVAATSVSLGFALGGTSPTEQSVYAFLPVRRCGLKFMLQGDFVVPSNRGDVDYDNPFNQLLRSRVPGLLAAALSRFKGLPVPPGQPPLYWVDWWLQCIPLKSAVQAHDFFAQLPAEVATLLRATPCIPTEGAEGAVGTWVPPGLALICPNPRIRQLLSSPQLLQVKQQYFVHPGVPTLHQNKELRQLLGVPEYDPEHLVQLLQDLAAAGQLQQLGIAWLRQLLLCLFSLMFDQSSGAPGRGAASPAPASGGGGMAPALRLKLLQDLQSIPLLPVQGQPGRLWAAAGSQSTGASSQQQQLFMPLEAPPAGSTPAAATAAQQLQGKGTRGSSSRKAPSQPRPPSSPLPPHTPATHAMAASSSRSAAAVLAACSITQQDLKRVPAAADVQQQLAATSSMASGGVEDVVNGSSKRSKPARKAAAVAPSAIGSSGCDPGPAAKPGLIFLDAELLQVEDPADQLLLLKGLQELKVRPVEYMDVFEGWVLPSLGAWNAALSNLSAAAAVAAAAPVAQEDAAQQPSSGCNTSSSSSCAPLLAVVDVQLTLAQQQQLMALMAFPLAAGLLTQQLQQQQQPQVNQPQHGGPRRLFGGAGDSTPGKAAGTAAGDGSTALERLQQVAVAVTSTGRPVRLSVLQRAATGTAGTASTSRPQDNAAAAAGGADLEGPQQVYLPAALGNSIDLLQAFPSHSWTLVHPAYGNFLSGDTGVMCSLWGSLFRRCGIVEWLPLQRVVRQFQWKQLLLEKPEWKDAVVKIGDQVTLQDVTCPGFTALLASISAESTPHKRQSQLRALATLLGQQWQAWAEAGAFLATPVATGAGGAGAAPAASPSLLTAAAGGGRSSSKQQLPSSLLLELRQQPWLLSAKGEACIPSTLFVSSSQAKGLFQDKVDYAGLDQLPSPMIKELGVKDSISPQLVLEVLKSWSAAAESAATPFTTSLNHMGAVYTYLQGAVGMEELPASGFADLANPDGRSRSAARGVLDRLLASQMFSEHPLIWLPEVPAAVGALQQAAAGANPYGSRSSRTKSPAGAAAGVSVINPEAVQLLYRDDVKSMMYNKPLPGRFHTPEQLRFRDDARVLEQQQLAEQLSTTGPLAGGGAGAGQRPGGPQQVQRLRAVHVYYPTLMDFFVDQLQRFRPAPVYNPHAPKWIPLVGQYATVGDYCRLLDRVMAGAGDKVDKASPAYNQVMRVLKMWAEAIASRAMRAGTVDNLYQQLQENSTVVAGAARTFFPTTRGTWAPLRVNLLIDDMPEVSALFEDSPGVSFIDLSPDDSGTSSSSMGYGTLLRAPGGGSSRSDLTNHPLFPLLQAMSVQPLSVMLRRPPPVATDPTPDRDLHYVLAVAAPLLQRMTLHHLGDAGYTSSDAEFRAHLAGVKCWGVSALEKRVALPFTADNVTTGPGQENLVAGVACEVLLVTGDDSSDQVVIQRRRQPSSKALPEEEEEEEQEEEEEDEEGEQDGEESDSDHQAAADDGADGGSAAAAPADCQEQQQQQEPLERSVDLYVKMPRASGSSRVVASELSQLVDVIRRRLFSSGSGSSKVARRQQEQQAAWATLQGEAQQLLEQLLFVKDMGGALFSWHERPEYSHLPVLPEGVLPWAVTVPIVEQPEEAAEEEQPDAAAAAAAALAAGGQGFSDMDLLGELEETEQEAALRQMHAQTVQQIIEKKQAAVAAAAAAAAAAGVEDAAAAPVVPQTITMNRLLHVSPGLLAPGAAAAASATPVATTATRPAALAPEVQQAAAEDPERLHSLMVASDWAALTGRGPVVAAAAEGQAGPGAVQGAMAAIKAALPGAAAATAAAEGDGGHGLTAAPATGMATPLTAAAPVRLSDGDATSATPAAAVMAMGPPPGLHEQQQQQEATATFANSLPDGQVRVNLSAQSSLDSSAAASQAHTLAAGMPALPASLLSTALDGGSIQQQQHMDGSTPVLVPPLTWGGSIPPVWDQPAAASSPGAAGRPLHQALMQHLQQLEPWAAGAEVSSMTGAGAAAVSHGGSEMQMHPMIDARAAHSAGITISSSSSVGGGGHSSSSTLSSSTWLHQSPRGPAVSLQVPQGSYSEAVAAACQSGRMMVTPVQLPPLLVHTALAAMRSRQQLPPAAALGEGWTEETSTTGRLGEAIACASLQLMDQLSPAVPAQQLGRRVLWVNQDKETGLPFDMLVLGPASSDEGAAPTAETQQVQALLAPYGITLGAQDQVLAYVEVKSTRASHKELFEVSQAELAFAAQAGDRYWVLRVSGLQAVAEAAAAAVAGQAVAVSPSIQQLVNPVLLWQQQALRVCVLY